MPILQVSQGRVCTALGLTQVPLSTQQQPTATSLHCVSLKLQPRSSQ
jgi:hypothetical protein